MPTLKFLRFSISIHEWWNIGFYSNVNVFIFTRLYFLAFPFINALYIIPQNSHSHLNAELFSYTVWGHPLMRTSEDRSGRLITCIDNTGRSPVLTGELIPDDWHGLPVQVINGPLGSSLHTHIFRDCRHPTPSPCCTSCASNPHPPSA